MKETVAVLVLYLARVSSVAAFAAFQTGVLLLQNHPPPHVTAAMMTPWQPATGNPHPEKTALGDKWIGWYLV